MCSVKMCGFAWEIQWVLGESMILLKKYNAFLVGSIQDGSNKKEWLRSKGLLAQGWISYGFEHIFLRI